MREYLAEVELFLKNKHMYWKDIDTEQWLIQFQKEMTAGLKGEPSSLSMIPTFINPSQKIKKNKTVLVIDAGGTNLRVGTLFFDSHYNPHIDNYRKYPMLGTTGLLTSEEFFHNLANRILPLVELSDSIGFCFSFPSIIHPNKDGELIRLSKEMNCPELVGKRIGEGLKEALKKKGIVEDKKIILLNDTVATLLSGIIVNPQKTYSDRIGLILGTGLNSCYIESNKNISKREGLDPLKRQIINTESGSYGLSPQGEGDKLVDKETANPGFHLLEKMSSGGYFGAILTKTVGLADNLFSKKGFKILSELGEISAIDADNYLHDPHGKSNPLVKTLNSLTEADQVRFFHLVYLLQERGALLTACNLAGTILKSGCGVSPLRPIAISIDGSTFYKSYHYKQRVLTHLQHLLKDENKRYYDIFKVEDAPLVGAAIAILTDES